MARAKHGLPGIYNATVLTLTTEEGAAVGLSVRGFTIVEGNIADNGADSGNPIKIGGKYNSTLPTYANGDRGDLQIDASGRLIISGIASGDVAHDSADSGNPVKVGGKAYNLDGTVPGTAVAENDRANFITDVYGRQFVETTHPNLWSATDTQSSAQTNTALKVAPGAGLSLYITDIIVSNGATAGSIKFVEDTAGTPIDKLELIYLAINGGFVTNFRTPLKITANKDFGYTSATATTHSVYVSGFIAP